jgi:hypothetical protein
VKEHIVLIGADGAQLPAGSTEYVAIHNTKTGLMVAAPFGEQRFTHAEALAAVKGLTLAGSAEWRAPTVEELFPMADRTRFEPAVDPEEYPFIESDWYWTSTVDPSSPSGYAFLVIFGYGSAGLDGQYGRGRVLAVRSVVASAGQ